MRSGPLLYYESYRGSYRSEVGTGPRGEMIWSSPKANVHQEKWYEQFRGKLVRTAILTVSGRESGWDGTQKRGKNFSYDARIVRASTFGGRTRQGRDQRREV